MKADKTVILQEIYHNCILSRKDINAKLQNYKDRISELDAFLKSIHDNETIDQKFFSPRDAESIYSNRIKEINSEKENIEKESREYYHKLNQLDQQIEQLEVLLRDVPEEEQVDEEVAEIAEAEAISCSKHLKVLDIQEKERQRIARELHDSSVQNMTHLIHMIELSTMFIDQDPMRAKLELANCTKNLKEIIEEIRDTIFNLRPMSFDDLGFKQCIEDYIVNAKLRYNDCQILCDICDIDLEQYENKETLNLILVTIYRIIQEALVNALKHAQAEEVHLKVDLQNDTLTVRITDNGKGFDFDKVGQQQDRHFGLPVMRERIELLNGTLEIDTKPGNGTKVEAVIPFVR